MPGDRAKPKSRPRSSQDAPGRLKRGAGAIKRGGGAATLVALIASSIEPTRPLPGLGGARIADRARGYRIWNTSKATSETSNFDAAVDVAKTVA